MISGEDFGDTLRRLNEAPATIWLLHVSFAEVNVVVDGVAQEIRKKKRVQKRLGKGPERDHYPRVDDIGQWIEGIELLNGRRFQKVILSEHLDGYKMGEGDPGSLDLDCPTRNDVT